MSALEKIRQGIALFNSGRFDEAVGMLDPNVQWRARLGAVEGHALLAGRSDVATAWRDQSEAMGGVGVFKIEEMSIEDLGGGVILLQQRLCGRGVTSGVEVSDEFVTVWTFRGGVPVRVDSYDNRAAALADLATS